MATESTDYAVLVNNLFHIYRHPDGREYSHREVEEGITRAAGKKLIDSSYLSKIRNGTIKSPGIQSIEALCYFFPVSSDYFFPNIVALRQEQGENDNTLSSAMRSTGIDPDILVEQLQDLIRKVKPHKSQSEDDK